MLTQSLKKTIQIGAVFLLFFSSFGVVFAQIENAPVPSPSEVRKKGSQPWTLVPTDCLGPNAADYHDREKTDPVCGFQEMLQLVANIMGLLMVIALSLAALLFAYAGFKYATALGNPSQIQGAKKIFTNVAIGLIIVSLAFTIVQVVVGILGVEKDKYNQFLETQ